jgi:hypothetical protein
MLGIVGEPSLGACAGSSWPLLQQFTARIGVDTSAERIFFQLPLLDAHGVTRYTLNCAGGDEKSLDELGQAQKLITLDRSLVD